MSGELGLRAWSADIHRRRESALRCVEVLRLGRGEFGRSWHLILVVRWDRMPAVCNMLTMADREEISRDLSEGLRYKEIARLISRNPSVVSRDVARHAGRAGYRAVTADGSAAAGRQRPKAYAVDRSPRLRAVVIGLLRGGWSPASIAGRLPHDVRLRTGRPARRSGPRPASAPRIREPRRIHDWKKRDIRRARRGKCVDCLNLPSSAERVSGGTLVDPAGHGRLP